MVMKVRELIDGVDELKFKYNQPIRKVVKKSPNKKCENHNPKRLSKPEDGWTHHCSECGESSCL